jgi:hypothetical protein
VRHRRGRAARVPRALCLVQPLPDLGRELVSDLRYHRYVEQRVIRVGLHVAVHEDGRVLESDGLAAGAALVRALLRVVHLGGSIETVKQLHHMFLSVNNIFKYKYILQYSRKYYETNFLSRSELLNSVGYCAWLNQYPELVNFPLLKIIPTAKYESWMLKLKGTLHMTMRRVSRCSICQLTVPQLPDAVPP